MKEKILYYLGAGASANTLPLAKSIGKDLTSPDIPGLPYSLRTFDFFPLIKELSDKDHQEIVKNLNERFADLSRMAIEFGDVDTYAKYLHLMQPGGEKLQDLKRTLAEFFILKQVLSKSQDTRYLPWLVSLMNKKMFPENVKILSWNYDFQIQLAFEKISELEDIEYSGNSFTHSSSLLTYYPNLDPTFSEHSLLSLIHLNGIAGYVRGKELGLSSAFQRKFKNQIHSILEFIEENRTNTLIHFAWENSTYHSKLFEHIRAMIADTTIVVVIGYSFPFFNREIDKKIFDELKSNNKFRKIYYQDPMLNGEQLRAQFNLVPIIEIVHIPKTENFHVPFEY